MKAPEKTAVAGIIFDDSRTQVLLVQRRDIPVWVLPGGGVDKEESKEAAIQREMEEETGYKVHIARQIAEYEPVNRLTQRTYFFECTIAGGAPRLGDETLGIRFFPIAELPVLLPPPYEKWIMDARAEYGYVLKKKIEGVSYPVLIKLLCQHPILVCRFLLTKVGIHLNL